MYHCICKKNIWATLLSFSESNQIQALASIATNQKQLTDPKKSLEAVIIKMKALTALAKKNLENTTLSRQVCLLAISWAPGTKVSLQSTLCF